MGRARRQNVSNALVAFLLVIMLALAGAIIWLGVPMLAALSFGQPVDYLTGGQKWNYSLQLLMAKDELLSAPCTTPNSSEFVIEQGSSVNLIANNLEKAGLIRDAVGFRSYLIYKGLDTQILAGMYQLDCSLSSIEIADSIRNIYQQSVTFVILPGWRAEEIAAALPTSGIEVNAADFIAVVQNPAGLDLPDYLPEGSSVEGLLYPGEYSVERTISTQELVQLFVDRFEQEVSTTLLKEAKANGISPYQAIILASIVQRETFAADERPVMASVFYNRLALGMRLETDPTVQYVLGYDDSWGWWKSPLAVSDLQIDSEYNTYLISGLPPAPIANPDLASIQAVIHPEITDYLYFRAKCDGSGYHVFSTTFAEHQANGCN